MTDSLEKYEALYEEKHQAHWRRLQTSLEQDDLNTFREEFLDMHTYDQANFFIEQEEDMRQRIYGYLSPAEFAEIIESMEFEDTIGYFTEMNPQYSAAILSELPADDTADILNLLEKEEVMSFLTAMESESAAEVKSLLNYEEKTAGSIMTTEFIAIYNIHTVKQVMQLLKEEAPDAETIYYLYVIDEAKTLVGVISIRDLIIADEDTVIKEIMSEKVVAVSVAKDQEEIAQLFRDYDFLAVPVVDFQNRLLGIITVDDILDVMEEEASEDYSLLAGVSEDERHTDTAFQAAKKRLPWLIILLFLGLITASLIRQFEDTLDQVAILAIFIPLIAGMAGNTGTQSLAIAVRGLASGEFQKQGKLKLVLRELGTGMITGSVSGVVIAIVIFIWQQNLVLGLLVGVSIMASLIVATLAGSFIPMLMDRLNIDPAVASGPFITTLNDIISILIYFSMATSFMSYLG
ncbi:magnesium transporter [Oceanobacillus luteolus]|uniref:Magnesium transporter MgtE n=1 Tax=Oceanobacillus luteolus TaxID=1274358 RepID=A0ABW4HUF8_9BACI|nr:magnesium transporter [Oceanobacillus luteolus]MCM3741121.1 magnesium transporter [Oceanobacillus luteolus]